MEIKASQIIMQDLADGASRLTTHSHETASPPSSATKATPNKLEIPN
jgi:hypothetical protein